MKKVFSILLGFGIVAFCLQACKKNNLVVDHDDFLPPSFAKFNVRQASDTVGTYYVSSSGAGLAYKIPIGVTTVSDKARTIQLCYTSRTAVAGAQYNAPATVTIPAGQAVDTLVVSGLFAGYPTSTRVDSVYIKVCGGDVPANAYYNTYLLIMRKYCDVNLTNLAGAYNNSIDNGNYGPYPTTVVAGTTTGTTGTITVGNVWDPGVPTTTTVKLDWSNPAGFTTTIPDQVYYAPADIWIKGTTAGTFSSCDQSFTLRYTLYTKSTGANYSANQVTVIKR